MTDGRGRISEPLTTGVGPSTTTVALPASTRTIARRKETTASGSYPALSTRVRIRPPPPARTAPGRRKAPSQTERRLHEAQVVPIPIPAHDTPARLRRCAWRPARRPPDPWPEMSCEVRVRPGAPGVNVLLRFDPRAADHPAGFAGNGL